MYLSKRNGIHKEMSENIRFSKKPAKLTCVSKKISHKSISPETVSQAVAGNKAAIGLLVSNLTPVIQLAVAHILRRSTPPYQHNHVDLDIADYCQNVFMLLFKNNSKVLKDWDPAKGMNLKSYISLIAKRQVISSLRKVKFTQSLDDDSINENIESFLKTPDEGHQFVNRHLLIRIISCLKNEISEFGYEIFVQIFLYGFSAEEIANKTNLSKNSIYVWKNRLKKHVKKISDDLEKGWKPNNSKTRSSNTKIAEVLTHE